MELNIRFLTLAFAAIIFSGATSSLAADAPPGGASNGKDVPGARHDAANLAVIRAFARHWLGAEDSYVSMLVKKNPEHHEAVLSMQKAAEKSAALTTEIADAAEALADAKGEYRQYPNATTSLLRELRLKIEAAQKRHDALTKELTSIQAQYTEAAKVPAAFTNYVQIKGVDWKPIVSPLTEADILNGITYQGTSFFGFSVFRFYTPSNNWSDWQDSARIPASLLPVVANFLGGFTGNSTFPNLRFSFQERDGNWRVETDNGEVLVNDKRIDPADREDIPSSVCLLPNPAKIDGFLKTGKTPRDAARAEGEWARKNPDALEASIKKTVEMLKRSK